MRPGRLDRLLGGLLLWCGAAWGQATPAAQPLTLGVVPQFPSVELQRRWTPVIDLIEQGCQVRINLVYAATIPDFEQRFLKGQFDLAYVNPYHAVMARKSQGYEPLVREGKELLNGILVVRADAPQRHPKDLQGATIAFPAPNAFGASLYMRALLEREHGIRFTASYTKTHSNSYRHVLKGEALAAGGIGATLEAEKPEIQKQLRVLYETPSTAPHPLMAHPRLGASLRQCVVNTLTSPGLTKPQRDAMADAQIPNPVKAAYERDYQPLEKLSLESYVVNTPN